MKSAGIYTEHIFILEGNETDTNKKRTEEKANVSRKMLIQLSHPLPQKMVINHGKLNFFFELFLDFFELFFLKVFVFSIFFVFEKNDFFGIFQRFLKMFLEFFIWFYNMT